MGKWVEFVLPPGQDPKTSIWHVVAKVDRTILGEIRWYGRWRGYAFFPWRDTLYEATCLNDIARFITEAMSKRRGSNKL